MICDTKSIGALVALAGLCTLAGPAAAQDVIGGYRAYIGPADLTNSSGVRLTRAWQVIRQDRANVHRFGITQPGDEPDPWFGSGEMRGALENWVRYGGISPAAEAAVMAGGVSVFVEVLGQGSRASGVRVVLDGAAPGGGDPGGDPGGALIISPD